MQISKSLIVLLLMHGLLLPYYWGCGNSPDSNEDLEGFIFDTLPLFEKDSFIYPIATRSSSFRFPESFGGEMNVIDGNFSTYWQTIPGLITGEFIEFDFDSLFIGSIYVHVTRDLRFGLVKNILVYADGELSGNFPEASKIFIGKKVNTLRVELGETQGLNKVDLPLEQDSDRTELIVNRQYESVYTSKSIAVSEIDFFDAQEKRIPIRSVPVKNAKMNFYGTESPYYIYNARLLFDGKRGFGWKGTKEKSEKTLLFSFEEDQIINGLFFPYTNDFNLKKIGFRLRKRPLPEYEIKFTPGKGIFIELKNTLKGKIFEFVILETINNQEPYIPELLFFDGSRMFSIYSDSLEYFQKQRLDSVKNTPLETVLDSRQKNSESRIFYTLPLLTVFNKNKSLKDSTAVQKTSIETIFRISSNGSFGIYETVKIEGLQNNYPFSESKRKAEGYWFSIKKSSEENILKCFADYSETSSRFIPGKPPTLFKERKQIEFEVFVLPDQLYFNNGFGSIRMGY